MPKPIMTLRVLPNKKINLTQSESILISLLNSLLFCENCYNNYIYSIFKLDSSYKFILIIFTNLTNTFKQIIRNSWVI